MMSFDPQITDGTIEPTKLDSHKFSRISKGFGRCFQAIVELSQSILKLAMKVKMVAYDYFRSILSEEASSNFLDSVSGLVEKLTSFEISSSSETKQLARIDVPGDGNCLFYCMVIALRKFFPNIEEIQQKLKWDFPPEKLGINFLSADEMKSPANLLRLQAAEHLEKKLSKGDETTNQLLMSSVLDYQEVLRKDISEIEASIDFLYDEIEEIRKNPSKEIYSNIMRKQTEIGKMIGDILSKKAKLDLDEKKYLELSKEDHFYSGGAQFYALSEIYQVSIRVLYGFGKPIQYEQTFAPNHPSGKVITVEHVDDNHFQLIND